MHRFKEDCFIFMPASQVWVNGFCSYADGVGDVKVNLRDSFGQVVSSLLKDVHYAPDLRRLYENWTIACLYQFMSRYKSGNSAPNYRRLHRNAFTRKEVWS